MNRIKRHAASDHFIDHNAQRIEIRARVEFIASHPGSLLEAEIDDLDNCFAFVAPRQEDVIGFEVTMNDAQLVRGVQASRCLLENFRNLRHRKRTPPREGLTERFAFQKLHGDVGRAVIGLAGFVNGDDIGVMNAPRGSRLILKAQQEVGVIQQLAAQDFERHGTVAHRDLLGEKDRTHAALTKSANEPEMA
jgi:hypothetical protein